MTLRVPVFEVFRAPDKGVAEGAGAPSPDPGQGVAGQEAEDSVEQLRADLAKAREEAAKRDEEYQGNLRRLTSTYDSKLHALQSESTKAAKYLEDRLHAAETQDMDELQRTQYDYGLSIQRNEELEQQIASLQEQAQNAQLMSSYIGQFLQAGVDPRTLNFESLETLVESGWKSLVQGRDQLAQKVSDLEQQVNTLRDSSTPPKEPGKEPPVKQTTPPKPGQFTPPRVASPTPASPATPGVSNPENWGKALEALKAQYGREFSVAEVLQLVAERKLPPEILPGMEGYSREALEAELAAG